MSEGLEPALIDPSWFQDMVARWRLGRLTFEEVSAFATVALTRELDGPALRELAWRQTSWLDVDPLFEQAVAELGLVLPSRGEALARLLGALAREVVEGRRPLLDGATAINGELVGHRFDGFDGAWPPGFDPWLLDHLLDDWAEVETPVARAAVERNLLELVTALLPPQWPEPGPDAWAPTLGGPSLSTREAPTGPTGPAPARASGWFARLWARLRPG